MANNYEDIDYPKHRAIPKRHSIRAQVYWLRRIYWSHYRPAIIIRARKVINSLKLNRTK